MLVPLLVFAFVIPGRPRPIGLFALLLIPPAVIVALAAGSRGPFAAFGLIAGVATIRYIVARRRAGRSLVPAVAIAAGLVCAVALAVPALPALSVDRFTNLAEFVTAGGDVASSGETSGSARLTLYSEALSIFDDYPLFGAGTGAFGVLSREDLDPTHGHDFPHNAFLQIAAEFGLIGVVCFVSAVFVALGRRFPRRGSLAALKLVFIYFLLNSMVSDDIIADRQTIGLLLLVLAVDLSRVPVAAVGERTIGRISAALVPAR
jgi:O-antigen ligase